MDPITMDDEEEKQLREEMIEKCYELALHLRLQPNKTRFYPEDIADKFKRHHGEDLPLKKMGFADVGSFLRSSPLFIPSFTHPDVDPRLRIYVQEDYQFKHKLKPDSFVTPPIVDLTYLDTEGHKRGESKKIQVKKEPKPEPVDDYSNAVEQKYIPPVPRARTPPPQPNVAPVPQAPVAGTQGLVPGLATAPQENGHGQPQAVGGVPRAAVPAPQPRIDAAPPGASSDEEKPEDPLLSAGQRPAQVAPPPFVLLPIPPSQTGIRSPASPQRTPENNNTANPGIIYDPRRVQPSIVCQKGNQLFVTPPGLIPFPQLGDGVDKNETPEVVQNQVQSDPAPTGEKPKPWNPVKKPVLVLTKEQQTVVDRTRCCLRDADGVTELNELNRDYQNMFGMSFMNSFKAATGRNFRFIEELTNGEIVCKLDSSTKRWMLGLKCCSQDSDAPSPAQEASVDAGNTVSSRQPAPSAVRCSEIPLPGPTLSNQPAATFADSPASPPPQFRAPASRAPLVARAASRLPQVPVPTASRMPPPPVPPPPASRVPLPPAFTPFAAPTSHPLPVPPPSYGKAQLGFPFGFPAARPRDGRAASCMPRVARFPGKPSTRDGPSPGAFVPNPAYINRLVAGRDPFKQLAEAPLPPLATPPVPVKIDIMERIMACLEQSDSYRLDQKNLCSAYLDRYKTDFNRDVTHVYKNNRPDYLQAMVSEKIEMYRDDSGRWIYRLRSAFRKRNDGDVRDWGPVRFPVPSNHPSEHNPVRRAVTRMPNRYNRASGDDRSRFSVDRTFGRGHTRSPPRRFHSPKRYRRD